MNIVYIECVYSMRVFNCIYNAYIQCQYIIYIFNACLQGVSLMLWLKIGVYNAYIQ